MLEVGLMPAVLLDVEDFVELADCLESPTPTPTPTAMATMSSPSTARMIQTAFLLML